MGGDPLQPTNAVFSSSRFNHNWGEGDSDSDPPPGRDLAVALQDAYELEGIAVRRMPEGSDPKDEWWEHDCWYFWLTWGGQEYSVHIGCISDTKMQKDVWRITLTRRLGCLHALCGGRIAAYGIDADLMAITDRAIQRVAEADMVHWVTDEQLRLHWDY
jgi:hypothetical protein